MNFVEWLQQPMPWYISGLLIGLMVPGSVLLLSKPLGVSSSFQHGISACMPTKAEYFNYDWKSKGLWNLVFVFGMFLGGMITSAFLMGEQNIAISEATVKDLAGLGITDVSGLIPKQIFSLESLMTLPGMLLMVGGGFLVGFGARYAGGCTSGHAIMGMSQLSGASVVAVIGFFSGGLFLVHFILPYVLSLY